MPKFTILGRLPAERIPAAVPPGFRERVRLAARPGAAYTVLLFAHDHDRGVVTSAAVRRALGRVPEGEPLLAVGRAFTQEATEQLECRNAAVVRLSEHVWTDASYQAIRRGPAI